MAYAYLSFFLDDDAELARIREAYTAGTLATSQLKARCIEVLQGVVGRVQDARANVDDEVYAKFTTPVVRDVKFG